MGGIGIASEVVGVSFALEAGPREVKKKDIEKALDACEHLVSKKCLNVRIIHAIDLKYQLDGEMIHGNPLGLTGKKLSCKAIVVTAQEHHFEDLVAAVNEAGLDILDVVASPLAVGLAALEKRQMMTGCAMLDIGAETTSLVVYEDGLPFSLHVFAIGASDITNDIALGFRIPLDQAEKLKLGKQDPVQQYSRSKIEDIIEARLFDVFELVDKHLHKIGRQGLLPGGIIIAGGGSILNKIDEYSKAALKLPSRVVRLDQNQSIKRKLPDNSWLLAYGLSAIAEEDHNPLFRQERIVKNLMKATKNRLMEWLRELIP
jgi:cell division protein FtsA